MTDYKEKYERAVKALDGAEKESGENIQALYKVVVSILGELKGQHKEVDKVIASLPKKIANNALPPIEELTRIKDLIISFFNNHDDAGAAPAVLDTLLSNLKVSDALGDDVAMLQERLLITQTSKDFIEVAKSIASSVLKNTPDADGANSGGESILDIKQGLTFQLKKLSESDTELAKSIDINSLIRSLEQVSSLRDLEFFYKQVFEGLGKRISKKDEFIVELSGLIETVVQQLVELSSDLKQEGVNNADASKDRWRLTELMGGQINTLRDSVLQTDSLDTLKSMINEHLGELNKTVSDFTVLEGERAKQAEQHAVKVTNKLNKVESEVQDLKSSLEKAHEQAFLDPLTGVANRRAYDQRIKLEFERWKRSGDSLTVAIMDIDHFKNINDTYGHPIGDKVLKTISQLINKKVRESDFFGRVGGEEFVVIFAGSDIKNALKRLEEFRKHIESCKFGSKGKRIVITMSAGCAVFHENDTVEVVYDRADQALLKAKKTGRNKCLSELD
jgi:diguanylate cyclase